MNDSPAFPRAVLGFGGATFGREVDDAASFELMDYAWEHGIRHFDTAAAYSSGASERIVGRWLAMRRPEGLTLATKALPPYTSAALLTSLRESLERLGQSRVDIYYLHRWDSSLGDEGLVALDRAVQEGRVGMLGISNVTPAVLATLLQRQAELGLASFRVLQCNHNYAVSELDAAMQAVQAEHGFDVVTFSPLGAGFLTGKHTAGVVEGSRFAIVPGHQAIYFKPEAKARLERLHSVAASRGITPERLALAWALRTPAVGTVLVGGRSKAHLDQALAARDDATSNTAEALVALTQRD